jgi:hypothetical protein
MDLRRDLRGFNESGDCEKLNGWRKWNEYTSGAEHGKESV